ncbi:ATP-binding protein [Trueperella abortisuis]|uniref:DNA replication protein DnaC n=1 Tax=Trueperella abortisuis TaxID=445930 RepID=A0ABT9PIX9_9ACTO|nr:ATP-binding protein [Trueperella abortisuis]MDP9831587.1 DNA replication protein DnaC [Trueperella abortisuis]MDP9831658.1 DNA replication protein DnaC [Trueperella abortisuis]MDP9832043.1 DNA replication protein DnaC [Trueperella abortisuis]MDP9832669.1 DNA replication protein DnaC [Trueperella abortisuis]MDP9832760.1 DNA replication protein DnaC [Trueperella abortisuis]
MTFSTAPRQHLDDTWMETFTKLRMTAFGQTVISMANDSAFDEWTFSDKIIFAVEKEVAARAERRFAKLLKASMTPLPDACAADIRHTPKRNLTRELTSRLAHCQWIEHASNVVILGKSSVGKTYLACALLHEACKRDYSAKFFRTADLADQLAVLDRSDPARLKFINQIVGCDLLVLDDFLTTPISGETANELFNLLAAREGRGSTMVTSQFAPEDWYESMPDRVVAESLLNRLVGGAEIVNVDGPNMRLAPTVS